MREEMLRERERERDEFRRRSRRQELSDGGMREFWG